MIYSYCPRNICVREFVYDIDKKTNTVMRVAVVGGCQGFAQGFAKLASGHSIDELIGMLKGIRCGRHATSCSDQFARGLMLIREDLKTGDVAIDLSRVGRGRRSSPVSEEIDPDSPIPTDRDKLYEGKIYAEDDLVEPKRRKGRPRKKPE